MPDIEGKIPLHWAAAAATSSHHPTDHLHHKKVPKSLFRLMISDFRFEKYCLSLEVMLAFVCFIVPFGSVHVFHLSPPSVDVIHG